MAITPNDFSKIWASNADTPEYTFSEANYLKGWDFVGNLPPTRAQWNALQKSTDEKMKYVFDNFGAPLTASTVAEMTMQNRVYVYTGSETGYTAGHWYYWNGSAWTDGGVYNSIAFSTDTTLTISGQAADAKATGDAIKSTKSEMSLFGVDDLLWDNTNPSTNTQAGVSWTVDNIDKTVTVTGTATGTSVINFYGMSEPYPSWLEKGKQYFLHFENENVYAAIQYKNSSNTEVTLLSTHTTKPFVIPADAQAIRIRLTTGSGATGKVYNTVARPFISEAKTLFELDNIDESIVKKLGIVVAEWESGGIYTNNGNKYTDSTKVRSADFVPVVNGEKLIVCTSHDAIAPVIFYNADKSYNSYVGGVTNRTIYVDVPNNAEYMKIQASNSVSPSTQITADFGSNVSVYRVDGDIYRSLVYMGVRYGITEDDFTTIADLPINSVVRIPRDWLDTDVETLPYYNEIEYYIFTFGRVDGINFKTQIALDPTWNCFYVRSFDVDSNVWGDWNLVGKEIQRTYTDNELDANQVILLSSQYVDNLYFNSAQRVVANANYKSKLIPIKKGTTVFLNTSGATALPYAKIKHNFLIDEVADSSYFSGYITFDYDGFLAVNCYNGNYEKFICKVFIDNAETVNSVQFTNALQVPSIIPEYDPNNVCRVLNRGSSMMGAIHSWGIIGASWDCGEMNYTVPGFGQKEIDWEEYSSWTVLKKLNNIPDLYIYASGGQNAKDWISLGANTVRGYAYDSDTEVVNPYWSGRSGIGHFGGCWWKVKDDYEHGIVKQAYYVGLGGNDIANNYPFNSDSTGIAEGYDPTRYYECGTIEDIGTYDFSTDTDTVPAGKTAGVVPGVVNSFCAYIGAILNRLIAIQPNCIIFLATPRNSFGTTQYQLEVWEQYCDAIHQIAQMPQFANNVYVLPLGESIENNRAREWRRFILGNHPDALGYHYLAYYLNTLIDYVILTNYINMKQSMYIGTDKHWAESDV